MLPDVKKYYNNPLIREPFLNVFHYSFCWSSNALEGNTLSLDDTISFLDYDEVRSGHKFSEYEEAKRLHDTIKQYLSFQPRQIDLDWIIDLNHGITGEPRGLRTEDVYIGNQLEAVYYPPSHSRVAELIDDFLTDIQFQSNDVAEILCKTAETHIAFERIHPFKDGNGRTGRMILNQCLINNGLLPVILESKSSYRKAFKVYNKNGDQSLMEHLLCKAERQAMENVLLLAEQYENSRKEPDHEKQTQICCGHRNLDRDAAGDRCDSGD